MSIKSELRKEIKHQRKLIQNKDFLDETIVNQLLNSSYYKSSNTILSYASLDDEICTDKLINNALSDGKTVALPYCCDNEGHMLFYIIKSMDDLVSGSFGVREPNIDKCKQLNNFDNALIIVPGLCFSQNGNRLGYGKGYYDRFLQNNSLISIGLCYNSFIKNDVPTDKYDIPVDFIISEKRIYSCKNGGKNG